jgi:hypothetical protein
LFILSYGGQAPFPGQALVITDFEIGNDVLQITGAIGISEFSNLLLMQSGSDTTIGTNNGIEVAKLLNIDSDRLNSSSFQF